MSVSPPKAHHPCVYGVLLSLLCFWGSQPLSMNLSRCILKSKLSRKHPNYYNHPCLVCGITMLIYFNFTKLSRNKITLYLLLLKTVPKTLEAKVKKNVLSSWLIGGKMQMLKLWAEKQEEWLLEKALGTKSPSEALINRSPFSLLDDLKVAWVVMINCF